MNKSGIQATYFDVDLPEYHEHPHDEHHHEEHPHDGEHHHDEEHIHHHAHRNLQDIEAILDHSELDAEVIAKAKDVFLEIAKAEAKVHGTTVEKSISMKWVPSIRFSTSWETS